LILVTSLKDRTKKDTTCKKKYPGKFYLHIDLVLLSMTHVGKNTAAK